MSTLPSRLDLETAARSADTTADALDRLALDLSFEVRGAVADNPRTHPRTLLRLAKDPDDWVLSRLVLRPLPTKAVRLLARNERPHVRIWVAEFQYCPA